MLPLAPGLAMMGYGARAEPARGLHDPLHARALFLEGREGRVLLLSLEVCLIAPAQARELRTRIARASGLAEREIVVSCIHTHSGPDTGLGALLAGQEPPPHVRPLLDAAVEAGCAALAEAVPARLGVGFGRASIGRNRRRAGGPVDERLRVVRVDRTDGAPLALVYALGCHPTVLGHDNLMWSADWPWAAGQAIREGRPGVEPLFLLTAHADVDPRTRGLQDLAKPGQSVGEGFDVVEAIGREVGEETLRVADGIVLEAEPAIAVRKGKVALRTHTPEPGAREDALTALGLPPDAPLRTAEIFAREGACTEGLPPTERRERIARVRRYLRDQTARHFAFGARPEVEVQALAIGPLRLLALPLEPTVEVGRAWSERTGSAGDAVLSIAGGWLRYLPHPRDFAEPGSHLAYEILQSTFEPRAAEALLDLGARLAAGLPQRPGG